MFRRRWSLSQSQYAAIKKALIRRPFAYSLVAGFLAMIFAGMYLERKEAKLLFIADPLPVVIASRDIEKGEMIDASAMDLAEIPRRFVQPGAISRIEGAAGAVAIIPIEGGAQLTRKIVARPGAETGVSATIEDGMRAVSMGVDEVSGVAGLIKPGDRVDVLATFDFGDEAVSRKSTISLLQDVLVIATGSQVVGGSPEPQLMQGSGIFGSSAPLRMGAIRSKSITLMLSPVDAQALVFAQETGVLSIQIQD